MVLSREKLADPPPPNLHIGICMVSFLKKINFKIFILGGAVVCLAVNVAFPSCGEQGYSPVAVRGLLIAVASLVSEHRLWSSWASIVAAQRLSSCSTRAGEQRLSRLDAQA